MTAMKRHRPPPQEVAHAPHHLQLHLLHHVGRVHPGPQPRVEVIIDERMNPHPKKAATTLPLVRCAVYTRKSTEEGLEQEFNSLDSLDGGSLGAIGEVESRGRRLRKRVEKFVERTDAGFARSLSAERLQMG
jgi:hypothetical protein